MPPRKSDVRPSTPVAAEGSASPPAKSAHAQEKLDKKDKDKEKDKDKDKGKGEDAVTIEVCFNLFQMPVLHFHGGFWIGRLS